MQTAQDGRTVCLLGNGERGPKRGSSAVHDCKREIDEVPGQRRVIETPIGVREEFLGHRMLETQRRDGEPAVERPVQIDARLQQDLELDSGSVDVEERSDPIAIGPHLSREWERLAKNPAE